MQRGQVWLHESPTRKARPVLILTRDSAIGVLQTVVAVPGTRTIRSIPTEVPTDETDGMRQSCVLSTDNIGLYKAVNSKKIDEGLVARGESNFGTGVSVTASRRSIGCPPRCFQRHAASGSPFPTCVFGAS
jgi:mRNA-degrading endonuclease toxin of MazEF toxin-antitoxin module